MNHKYITTDSRNKIEALDKEGYSARKIAKILAHHHSSISRELKRYSDSYKASQANLSYMYNSKKIRVENEKLI